MFEIANYLALSLVTLCFENFLCKKEYGGTGSLPGTVCLILKGTFSW
jgi:hypothetical protein